MEKPPRKNRQSRTKEKKGNNLLQGPKESRKRDHAEKVNNLQENIKKRKREAGLPEDMGIDASPSKRGVCSKEDEVAIREQEKELVNLEKQSIRVTPGQINNVKSLLRLMGQIVVEAESEGKYNTWQHTIYHRYR
jgi:membrane carboxypeptidase/penicillin-binding protein